MEFGREQTEFNDSLGKLNRINQLFYDCTTYRSQLNAYAWLHSLISLYAEFAAYMKADEITWCEERRKVIAQQVNSQVSNIRSYMSSRIDPTLFEQMFELELKMRKIGKEQGMELKMQNDPSRALG